MSHIVLTCQFQLVLFWYWSICGDRGTELHYTFTLDHTIIKDPFWQRFPRTCMLSDLTCTTVTWQNVEVSSWIRLPSYLSQHIFHLKDDLCVVLSRCATHITDKNFNNVCSCWVYNSRETNSTNLNVSNCMNKNKVSLKVVLLQLKLLI